MLLCPQETAHVCVLTNARRDTGHRWPEDTIQGGNRAPGTEQGTKRPGWNQGEVGKDQNHLRLPGESPRSQVLTVCQVLDGRRGSAILRESEDGTDAYLPQDMPRMGEKAGFEPRSGHIPQKLGWVSCGSFKQSWATSGPRGRLGPAEVAQALFLGLRPEPPARGSDSG